MAEETPIYILVKELQNHDANEDGEMVMTGNGLKQI